MPRPRKIKELGTLIDLYQRIPEPRIKGRCKHKLVDILVIITCSYLCGVSDWEEVELFANEKIDWFKKYLELPGGIPSHDTFLRVFKLIDPHKFELIFMEWIQSVIELKRNQVIAFDGKKVSGTYPHVASTKGKALCLLNIWATANNLTLGQYKIASTGFSECVGVKECLDYINVKGMIVTADAASAFPTVAEKVCKKGADYLLPIKRSNRKQAMDLDRIFTMKMKANSFTTNENNRGRDERRSCLVVMNDNEVDKFGEKFNWPKLKTIAQLKYYRKEKDKRNVKQEINSDGSWKWIRADSDWVELNEKKYYLSSKKLNAKELMKHVRSHWHLENKLNWHLDVTFSEDANRTRDKVASENMSMVRKICLNLLMEEKTFNKSLKLKKRKCQMNEIYLEKVLFKI